MKRRIELLDVIAFVACCWVAFMVMTHGRDLSALIEQFKEQNTVYDDFSTDTD